MSSLCELVTYSRLIALDVDGSLEDATELEKADNDGDAVKVDGTMLSEILTVALDDSDVSVLELALRD